jgi:prepilin-type N-terminal cleavage/methylation domain-containing protein
MNIHSTKRKARGFTLIELMIVLVIIAVAALFILGRSATARDDSEVNAETANVAHIIAKTEQLRSGGSFGAAGTNLVPLLINKEAFPKSMSISGTTVSHGWNGAVTIVSTGPSFSVTYAAVPKKVCSSMAVNQSQTGSVSTKINAATAVVGAVSAVTADTDCSAATNTITWTVI